ncbi:MAG: bifunctional 4-hydroxy-2-oxoglutarate aldolase/2-dehydro-3-deoxy-phosphogluconate aldolase [Anaerolineae bacterium]|nr:MAG: bifunctional 4-hydroxy-2-oxoglutarate aldolase/2-dehydro-3-deoxy-phosphogluconate aldolase [Anaerolineae bacterium]
MNTETAYGFVERTGLMAGMRGHFPPENALKVTSILMEEGISVYEFTMNSAGAVEAMQAVKQEFGAEACVGMGTVLDAATAQHVLDAGADFIVSPAFSPAVVKTAQAADVLVAPGVITPTEIVDAWAMGVKLLKIFPIGPLGLDYFKTIRGPLDHIKFMCNGGTNDVTVRQFMEAGALACGMANWLTGDGHMPLDTIRSRARLLVQIVNEVRTGQKTPVTV